MDLFTPKSEVVERIEKITAETLLREDVAAYDRLCDYINAVEDGPKEALKGIKKRLKHKNPKVVLFALKLLEACVNHCGEPLHSKLVSKDFLPDFIKLLKIPNQNEDVVEKILDLIQIWAVGLAYDSINAPLLEVQSNLLDEGMEFPYRDLSSFSPISRTPRANPRAIAAAQNEIATQALFDPRGTAGVVFSPPAQGQHWGAPAPIYHHGGFPGQVIQPSQPPRQMVVATPEKIKQDLSSMRACVELLAETLTFVDPKTEDVTRNELIRDCHGHCKQWQTKLNEYLQLCEDETLLVELLMVNDEFNSRFEFYSECAAKYLESNPLANLGPTLPPRTPSGAPSNPAAQTPQPSRAPPSQQPGQFSYSNQPAPDAPLISFDDTALVVPTNPLLIPSSTIPASTLPTTPIYFPNSGSSSPPLASSSSSSSITSSSIAPSSTSITSAPTPTPTSAAPADERLRMKEILGVDPDEFSEDQLAEDLASLGFTKEQLLEMRKNEEEKDPDEESLEGFDDDHRLMDRRMAR